MNVESFINTLSQSKPSVEELELAGLDKNEVDEIMATFDVKSKIPHLNDNDNDSVCQLKRLVTNFDCSTVEIGSVQFLKSPEIDQKGFYFGRYEADYLYIIGTGQVVAYDHAEESTIYQYCAESGEHFLDVLAVFLRELNLVSNGGQSDSSALLDKAISKAGGNEYTEFINSFIGPLIT